MALETATYVSDLVTTNPIGATDKRSQGDDHLRLLKSVLKATFPIASAPFYFPHTLAKAATYTIVAADDNTWVYVDATAGAVTLNLTAAATLGGRFRFNVMKIDSSANTVTIDPAGAETVNGAATLVLGSRYKVAELFCTGTAWYACAYMQAGDASLLLASGGVINFNSGDVLITHSANTLAFTGAASGYTFDVAPSVGGSSVVLSSRTLTAAGIVTGGGTLSADRTFTVTAATQSDQETSSSTTVAVVPGVQQFHPSAAKCWAYVTVSGGTPTLATSYNITSITDVGVGDLTITIATDFSTANWSSVSIGGASVITATRTVLVLAKAAGSVELGCFTSGPAAADPSEWNFVGNGDQ